MVKKLKKFKNKLYNNNIVRYIFFGGLTTLVNLISYTILRNFMDYNLANLTSIILAILFAYFVNSRFVFESKADRFSQRLQEFIKFIGARVITMLIELIGLPFFVYIIGTDDVLGKVLIQFLVLVLNYLFSKLLVFKPMSK